MSNIFLSRGLRIQILFLAGLLSTSSFACSVPVFRYALERWRAEAYTAWVLNPGPLTPPYKETIEALDEFCQKNAVNMAVQVVDTTQPLPEALEAAHLDLAAVKAQHPVMVVRFPDAFQIPVSLYSGPIDAAVLQGLLNSKGRQNLLARLAKGDSAVFVVFDDGGDKSPLADQMLREADRLQKTLRLPQQSLDDPESSIRSALPLKIAFSVLRVNRQDPAEAMFVAMLTQGMGLKGGPPKEPFVALIFGQGRLFDVQPASEMKPDVVSTWGEFTCGPCMCQVKEENPGMDLLMTADWEDVLNMHRLNEPKYPDFKALLKTGSAPVAAATPPPPLPSAAPEIRQAPTSVAAPAATPPPSPSTPKPVDPPASSLNWLWAAGALFAGLGLIFSRLPLKTKTVGGSLLLVIGLVALLPGRQQAAVSAASAGKSSPRQSLLLYCAAGIRGPVEAIRKEYEAQYGVDVEIQYGGSGTLLSNLTVANKGDLYISADMGTMHTARIKNLVREVIPLARQNPVIVVPHGNPKHIASLSDLSNAQLKWAFANPDAASIGKVTKRVLEKRGVWETVSRQAAVFKPTVNEAANDVKLGSVDAAVVWSSTAVTYPELEAIRIPEFDTETESVQIGVLSYSVNPAAALHFARYLSASDKGLVRFKKMGFEVPEGDVWHERPELILYSGAVQRLAIEPLIQEFSVREGVDIKPVFNGCGILTAQMKIDMDKGTFPDVYFACDHAFMEPVSKWFAPSEVISETDIVMLVGKGNPKHILDLKDLSKPGLKLGIGNCQQCTLGLLTKKFLTAAEGQYESIAPNIRSEQPTADVLVNQLQTGSLDVAIVYKINADQVKEKLESVKITETGALAQQPVAISKTSSQKMLARRFIDAIKAPESQKRFESLGFRWKAKGEGQ